MNKRDIILMNAPFTNLSDKKIRPALVLAKIQDDLLVCFIGSKPRLNTPHEIPVKADEVNNLRVDSVVKCNKIFTLHASLSKAVLGTITPKVYDAVVRKITEIIQ